MMENLHGDGRNKMSEKSSSSGGLNVLGLLGVVFVTLKLCGVIDWSWWWVTAPFWGGLAFLLAIVAFLGLFLGVCILLDKISRR